MLKATRDQAHDYLADLLAGENAVAVLPGPEREELINELARQEVGGDNVDRNATRATA